MKFFLIMFLPFITFNILAATTTSIKKLSQYQSCEQGIELYIPQSNNLRMIVGIKNHKTKMYDFFYPYYINLFNKTNTYYPLFIERFTGNPVESFEWGEDEKRKYFIKINGNTYSCQSNTIIERKSKNPKGNDYVLR